MNKNNKTRLLKTLQILKRKTDDEHHLSLKDIGLLLNEMDIEASERKTFYDDVKVLMNEGYDIEHALDGYYLKDAPFSLSEIKILTDSLRSLKTIDERMLVTIEEKLYSFISESDEAFLQEIRERSDHKNAHFLQSLEDVLLAIRNHCSVKAVRLNDKCEEIFPVYLHRERDHYYFIYHYPDSEKLYRFRFDSLKSVTLSDSKDSVAISYEKIDKLIRESTSSFHSGNKDLIRLKLHNKNLEKYLYDDFPGLDYSNDGYFFFEADINNSFFGKLAAYGSDIEILNKDIRKKYRSYLKDIVSLY